MCAKLPKPSQVEEVVQNNSDIRITTQHVRDYAELKMKEQGGEAERYLNMDAEKMINIVARKGSVDLGGGCKIVKCPALYGKWYGVGVCGLVPFKGCSTPICTGPTYLKDKLIFSGKKVVKGRPQGCPYELKDKLSIEEAATHLYKELGDHPAYTVVDKSEL